MTFSHCLFSQKLLTAWPSAHVNWTGTLTLTSWKLCFHSFTDNSSSSTTMPLSSVHTNFTRIHCSVEIQFWLFNCEARKIQPVWRVEVSRVVSPEHRLLIPQFPLTIWLVRPLPVAHRWPTRFCSVVGGGVMPLFHVGKCCLWTSFRRIVWVGLSGLGRKKYEKMHAKRMERISLQYNLCSAKEKISPACRFPISESSNFLKFFFLICNGDGEWFCSLFVPRCCNVQSQLQAGQPTSWTLEAIPFNTSAAQIDYSRYFKSLYYATSHISG